MNPGDSAVVGIKLIDNIALEKDVPFTIREGGRTIGRGKVVKLIR